MTLLELLPWRWLIAWSVVFAANLVAPLKLSSEITAKGGSAGMFAAVALYWLLSLAVCVRSKRFAKAVIVGGTLVGLSQFMPILHIVVGQIALALWWAPQGESFMVWELQPLSEAGGFAVTMMTGASLLGTAVLVGEVLLANLRQPLPKHPEEPIRA